jgi:pSer/pThr/pTyr-binding forkhead associated (FHA) protein
MPATFSSKHGAAEFYPIMRITGDPSARAPVALNKMVCVVGRGAGVNLPLDSTKVSKVHALIVQERAAIYIRDLASTNGVKVNDRPVRETELESGDVVHVGSLDLHCASGFSPRDAAAAREGDQAPRAPAAALEVEGASRRVPLDGRAVVVGRREACDLVLDDDEVSPVHAVVFERDGRRFVRDLHSGSGTFADGNKIHEQELTPGQEIRVGDTRIRYVEEKPSAAAEPGVDIAVREEDAIPIAESGSDDGASLEAAPETAPEAKPESSVGAEADVDEEARIPLDIDVASPADVEQAADDNVAPEDSGVEIPLVAEDRAPAVSARP